MKQLLSEVNSQVPYKGGQSEYIRPLNSLVCKLAFELKPPKINFLIQVGINIAELFIELVGDCSGVEVNEMADPADIETGFNFLDPV